MDPVKFQQKLAEAERHLQFCLHIYKIQIKEGRYFIHEHPRDASSWMYGNVQAVQDMIGVETIIGHMCRYGMISEDARGTAPVYKPTKFMTNSCLCR